MNGAPLVVTVTVKPHELNSWQTDSTYQRIHFYTKLTFATVFIIQSEGMGDIKGKYENKPFSTYKANRKTKHKDDPNVS